MSAARLESTAAAADSPPAISTSIPAVEQAIADLAFFRRTHVTWAEFFEKDPEVAAQYIASGEWDDAGEHRRIVGCYDRAIELLRAASKDAAVTSAEVEALRELVTYVHTTGCKAMRGPTLLARDCDCRVRLAKAAIAKLEALAARGRFELTDEGRAALAEPEVGS